tara:strand:- start:6622 stop:7158 length:537 start_codon:yes stop_codon:yes gene_type:complete
MKILNTKFSGLKVINGIKFNDSRGYFREIYLNKLFKNKKFIFWCMSKSKKNVLRGMHLQTQKTQEKFISVIKGKIMDVVIDCRKKSKTFGKHYKIILSDKNCKSLLIPSGFAHGILGLANENIIFYGNNNYRSVNSEVTIKWNDQKLKIKWPRGKKIISKKDKKGKTFEEFLNLKNEM